MFDINGFIMKTLKGMIGEYPDFQVREYALNWHGKGKLTEEDLEMIDAMIELRYVVDDVEESESESESSESEVESESMSEEIE
jgi:hypothetical protein